MLEALEEVPLPARCGFWAVPGGVAVEVVTRHGDQPGVRCAIERALGERGVPIRDLHLASDRSGLRRPLPLRGDLVARVAELPFAPLVAWPVGPDGLWLGLGLGDLLLATVFPLVLRKAYGRMVGLAALALSLGGLVSVAALAHVAAVSAFPVMVVLGPLKVHPSS